jgi:hypothetical protein
MWQRSKETLMALGSDAALVERGFSRFMIGALLVRNAKKIQARGEGPNGY